MANPSGILDNTRIPNKSVSKGPCKVLNAEPHQNQNRHATIRAFSNLPAHVFPQHNDEPAPLEGSSQKFWASSGIDENSKKPKDRQPVAS
jgi:hypothetical protein